MSETEDRLRAERPIPGPGFRGDLRRRLVSLEDSGVGQPPGLRLLIAAYAGSGLGLLAVAFAGILGGGPLAT